MATSSTPEHEIVDPTTDATEIPIRAVVMLDSAEEGIVTGVRDDGTLVIATRKGRWVERSPSQTLELVAGPDEPHPARLPIIDDWLERSADWSSTSDETTDALTRALWKTAQHFFREHGLSLNDDILVELSVLRPRVRVPDALRLRRHDMLEPFRPIGATSPTREPGQ